VTLWDAANIAGYLFRRLVCRVQHPAKDGITARAESIAFLKMNEPLPGFSLADVNKRAIKLMKWCARTRS
jgi:hypothetical protein